MQRVAVLMAVIWSLAPCHASVMLTDCNDLEGWGSTQKPATVELSTNAHEGAGAISVTMPGQVYGDVYKGYPPAAWDDLAGVSFWARGDGSDQWGCMALTGAGSNGSYSYCYFFPLRSEEWRRYEVAWEDWIPEGAYAPIGTTGSLPPSGIQRIRLGTRWTITHNNAAIPAHSYAVDEVRLEETIARGERPGAPRRLGKVMARLRDKQPVHIVCMGDSITAGTSLADKDAERYATRLQAELRKRLGYEQVYVESRAVGGAKLTDARAWVKRDFPGTPPDLITVLYGYNDKSGTWSASEFAWSLEDYIVRLTAATHGGAAILPLTTIPGGGPRYLMLDDFAQAVRDVSRNRGLTYCDLQATFKALGRDGVLPLLADAAHPNAQGHEVIARALADFLEGQMRDEKPDRPGKPGSVLLLR